MRLVAWDIYIDVRIPPKKVVVTKNEEKKFFRMRQTRNI
jgi:hypothetical protein